MLVIHAITSLNHSIPIIRMDRFAKNQWTGLLTMSPLFTHIDSLNTACSIALISFSAPHFTRDRQMARSCYREAAAAREVPIVPPPLKLLRLPARLQPQGPSAPSGPLHHVPEQQRRSGPGAPPPADLSPPHRRPTRSDAQQARRCLWRQRQASSARPSAPVSRRWSAALEREVSAEKCVVFPYPVLPSGAQLGRSSALHTQATQTPDVTAPNAVQGPDWACFRLQSTGRTADFA
jgi:hypothetical protein